ncbi:Thiosulfate sulfurtransferase/rhodanese-like domain-containing protein 3 [Hondaea fermentalgiana]|uniref:Thiosulfate sulfurtransferase/rhodanese-like domain-containing protein 3 n=1 Tax=Hondaea fermentalgiana TaxID=2315210 RepID=A0A2R5GS40_9STRA|nr:Thiosulfate sulfurtransferase/rhodanese-like domain-containing protein 3 [Hondaea fermentalgiana]|eukprot:GBG30694.1 Thiosulfate sulfurtransferase/rhodanese-like domain-containing protein 3 [Hondaea fermentalgiana]
MVSAGKMLQRAGILASVALGAPARGSLMAPAVRAAGPLTVAPAAGVLAQRTLFTALESKTGARATPGTAATATATQVNVEAPMPCRGVFGRLLRTQPQTRKFSGSTAGYEIMSIDELKRRMEDDTVLVIDVREPEEIAQTGAVAHAGIEAVNVPLGLILGDVNVLSMNPEEFEDEFGERLPSREGDGRALVFTCRSGVRAGNAAAAAASLGFTNVYNYKGSALEWFSQ